jgi:hypothetical protein
MNVFLSNGVEIMFSLQNHFEKFDLGAAPCLNSTHSIHKVMLVIMSFIFVPPPSTKECNYESCAGQTCSSLTKSKVNSICTYNFK